MKTKALIIPSLIALFLAGCNSSSSSGKKEKTTSVPPTTNQPVPSFPDLPDYGDYDGEQGIASDHFQGFGLSPRNVTYANIGDNLVVKTGDIKPNLSIPAEELVFSYEISNPNIISITPSEDTRSVTLQCLAKGDAVLTAYSFEKRFSRTLKVRVLPNDGTVDFYQPEVDSSGSVKAAEKQKFGWVSGDAPGGVASGDAVFGAYTWHFERSQVGGTITGGQGTFKFGTGTLPEGKMTFSTNITRAVKEVVVQCASAYNSKDPEADTSVGSSTFDAWFGTDDHLTRTVDGKTYAPGETCFTSRNTTEEYVQYHIIDCAGKSGSFTFELGPSVGAIYLKSILIEYAE